MERRRVARASVLLLVLQVGYARAESAFPNRYAKAAECSLQGMEAAGSGLDDACQLKSALGTGAPFGLTKGDGERLLVRAGETNCTVTLTKCRTDVCYTIRDAATSELPTSLSPLGGGPGIFASVDAISGVSGTGLTLSDYGVAFAPRESTVVLRYSTKLCGDFYLAHGGVAVQDCTEPIPAITRVHSGLPTGLPCGKR